MNIGGRFKKLFESDKNKTEKNISKDEILQNEKSGNFQYLKDLIFNGSKEIVLDKDIILSDNEIQLFSEGIKVYENNIVIDGNNHTIDARNKVRIFDFNGNNIRLKNLILKNGSNILGGAIVNQDKSSIELTNVVFRDNVAFKIGGAIFNLNEITLIDCKFINNSSKESGAAILNGGGSVDCLRVQFNSNISLDTGGGITNFGKFKLLDCKFINNSSKDDVISNQNTGELIISNCELNGNNMQKGHCTIANFGKIKINKTIFTNNRQSIGNFGKIDLYSTIFMRNIESAINNQPSGEMVISNCEFNENIVQLDGGAIRNFGKIDICDTNFSKNATKERDGGAINNQPSGEMVISNCEFNENNASSYGGAICNMGKIDINDANFTKNSAQSPGGAICNEKGSFLKGSDCIFKNNENKTFGSSIFNKSENFELIKCEFLQHYQNNDIIFNEANLNFINCIFKDNSNLDSIIFCDSGSSMDLLGGEISNNDINISSIHNKAQNFTIANTKFENNNSKSNSCQGDILNEGNLTLQAPKFKTDNYSVLNMNEVNVKKLSNDEIDKVIKNTGNGRIIRFDIPKESKYDFSHLNQLIQNDTEGIIVLKNDIILENYEYDFFEGGIEIASDDLIIDGNNHFIDAKNKTRIFNILGSNITIKNLILKNGYISNIYDDYSMGGGAIKIVKNSTVSIENCYFIDNVSDNNGGAICNNGTLSSKNNEYCKNNSKYNGGAINNNGLMCTINDTFRENMAKIASAIYNNEELVIKRSIDLINNSSDFDQPIYNANKVNINNDLINAKEIIYNTCDINKIENPDWDSFNNLRNQLEKSEKIILEKDVKLEFNYQISDEITINNDLIIDGNSHLIDLNHLNLKLEIRSNVVFKNMIIKNAYIHKNSLFELYSKVKFENVKFINNKIANNCSLFKNNENAQLEIIGSSFYNNSSRRKALIFNEGGLTIYNSHFINNIGQSQGNIVYNSKNNSKNVLIEDSCFINNFSADSGGLIYSMDNSICEVKNTQFINNTSKVNGGSICNMGTLKLLDSTFMGNGGYEAGSLYNSGNLDIINCNFNENTALTEGGVIINSGIMNCINTTFSNNAVEQSGESYGGAGGVMHNSPQGAIKIIKCLFNENIAKKGGAIINWGEIHTEDTNFVKNMAKEKAGAILNLNFIKVENCNFKGNKASLGNAIVTETDAELINSNFDDENSVSFIKPIFISNCKFANKIYNFPPLVDVKIDPQIVFRD